MSVWRKQHGSFSYTEPKAMVTTYSQLIEIYHFIIAALWPSNVDNKKWWRETDELKVENLLVIVTQTKEKITKELIVTTKLGGKRLTTLVFGGKRRMLLRTTSLGKSLLFIWLGFTTQLSKKLTKRRSNRQYVDSIWPHITQGNVGKAELISL